MTGSFAVGWRQVAAAFLLMGTMSMIASSYSVLAVPFAKEFGQPRSVLLLAMTVLSFVILGAALLLVVLFAQM